MKSLKDLADEWGESLHISYFNNVWSVSFLYSEPYLGQGFTLNAAIANYVFHIRGRQLNFHYTDRPDSNLIDKIKRVPEILTDNL